MDRGQGASYLEAIPAPSSLFYCLFRRAFSFPLSVELPQRFKEGTTVGLGQPGGIRRILDKPPPRQLTTLLTLVPIVSSGA